VRLLQGKVAEADEDFAKGFKLDPAIKPSFEKFINETKRQRAKK
jgi:hypothetical protein